MLGVKQRAVLCAVLAAFCLTLAGAQGKRLTLDQFNSKLKQLISEQLVVNNALTAQLQPVAQTRDKFKKVALMIPIYQHFADANEKIGLKYDAVQAPTDAEPVRRKMSQILHKIAALTRGVIPAMRKKDGAMMTKLGNGMTVYADKIPGEMKAAADRAGFDGAKFEKDGVLVKKH